MGIWPTASRKKMSGSGGGSGRFRIPTIWLDEQIPQGFSKKWAVQAAVQGGSGYMPLGRLYRFPTRAATQSSCVRPAWSSRLTSRSARARACCQGLMRPGGADSQSWRKALDMVSGWGNWRGANTAAGSEHVHTLTPRDSQCTHHTSHPPSNVSP